MTTHQDHYPIRVGALLWPQQSSWPEMEESARLCETVGLDSLWTWDHLHAIVGDPLQPIFEGWTSLAAWAAMTERIQVGLMVGANTFRNPGLTAKAAVTVDHISGGRAWLGIGGAWFGYEHTANGIDFGSGFGERLDWLEEAVDAFSKLSRGEAVTSALTDRYAFKELEHHPLPSRGPGQMPIMIGGTGERKTLRTLARHGQAWNADGTVAFLSQKIDTLRRHCDDVGRDPIEIEFTTNRYCVLRDTREEAERVLAELMANNDSRHDILRGVDFIGSEEDAAEAWRPFLELGFTHAIADLPAPHDHETIERLPRLRALIAGS
jgi:alkanesulfonate monooxygenase SsuD/methylene tetrahydromethanopterin reductase-like flavin-dependent oxidoreductase (luciferase family)